MTSGWCRGGRVGWQSCRPRSKARRHEPVRRGRRYQRGVRPCRLHRGLEAAGHGQRVSGAEAAQWASAKPVPPVSRCGTGCARALVPYTQNPGRPARREPHSNCGLPPRGKCLAGPASLFDILRGRMTAGCRGSSGVNRRPLHHAARGPPPPFHGGGSPHGRCVDATRHDLSMILHRKAGEGDQRSWWRGRPQPPGGS